LDACKPEWFYEKPKGDADLIVIDAKGQDLNDLIEKWNGKMFWASERKQLEDAVTRLEEIHEEYLAFQKVIFDKKLTGVESWEDLRAIPEVARRVPEGFRGFLFAHALN
jgi:hypothetical protein